MLLLTSVLGKELMLTVGMIPDRPWCCVVSYGRSYRGSLARLTDQKRN